MATKAKEAKKPQPKGKGGETVRILISRARLQRRITEMAREIRKDFPGEPLHLVGVLKGAVFFLTDLGKRFRETYRLTSSPWRVTDWARTHRGK